MVTYKKVSIVKDKMVIILGATNAIGVLLQYIALSMLSPVTVTLIAPHLPSLHLLIRRGLLKGTDPGLGLRRHRRCIAGSILVSSGGRNLIPGSVSSAPLSTRSCTRPTT
jgi:hypothetical protein